MLGAAAEIDGLIVLFNTPLLTTASDVATELLNARRELAEDAALVAVFMNRDGPPTAACRGRHRLVRLPGERRPGARAERRLDDARACRPGAVRAALMSTSTRSASCSTRPVRRPRKDGWPPRMPRRWSRPTGSRSPARCSCVRRGRPKRLRARSGEPWSSSSPPRSTRATSAACGSGWPHPPRRRTRCGRSGRTSQPPGAPGSAASCSCKNRSPRARR